ncbi:MAG: glycosyltransferase [Rhabdochlamydiaceae bacterium]|nr:glycosyltransferase [Candidatus Amphrikana amoebophyrae]
MLNKILAVLCGSLLLFSGCQKKEKSIKDFSYLMGKETSFWKHVQTPEDIAQVTLFEDIYQSGLRHQSNEIGESIPKTVHFIWVGPKAFPKTSKKNVESWVNLHPGWTFKFWTDRVRPLPHPRMQQVIIQPSHFQSLEKHFEESNNYAEKSDILRYEILKQEGGLYVDHDVVCYQSFDKIFDKHQFFCAVEPPHKPIATTSISVCNNIIGTIPNHPILEKCIKKVENRWSVISKMYPGNDQESIIYRVFNRTFCPFDESVSELASKTTYRDMVFPAGYFNRMDGTLAIFANHEYSGTWYKTEDPYETLVRRRLMKMSKKMNKILLVCGASVAMNIMMSIGVIFALRKRRHAS